MKKRYDSVTDMVLDLSEGEDFKVNWLLLQVEKLEREKVALEQAIRKHRDQKGDDRCYLDDYELYRALSEGYTPPPYDCKVELENCKKYIASRQDPDVHYLSPEPVIQSLKNTLRAAITEIEKHDNSYHYVTDREKLSKWKELCS